MSAFTVIVLFSGLCFVFYGFSCLLSSKMEEEFTRFGIPQYRKLTGILQILGGAGLIVGHYYLPLLEAIAAAGLSLLMFMGFAVRMKIKDSFALSAPALMFALLNGFIAYRLFRNLI